MSCRGEGHVNGLITREGQLLGGKYSKRSYISDRVHVIMGPA